MTFVKSPSTGFTRNGWRMTDFPCVEAQSYERINTYLENKLTYYCNFGNKSFDKNFSSSFSLIQLE